MRSLLALGFAFLWLVSPARGQVSIHLESTQCLDGELPLAQAFTLRVLARNANGSSFDRLEFRITGFPNDNQVFVGEITPNPEASSSQGNPFESGAIIMFPSCQIETAPILLYTATVFSTHPGYTPQIALQGIDAPSNPGFPCATVTSCDAAVTCLPDWVATHQILAPPHAPYPPDGTTGVSPNVRLSVSFGDVCQCLGLPCVDLFFGVEPDPPSFGGGCDVPLPQPGSLEPHTIYYWRVSMSYCGYAISPEWSFTTGDPVSSSPVDWGHVKKLFR